MVLVPLDPCTSIKVFGAADKVYVGGVVTVSEMVVARDKLPAVPLMVIVVVPVVAELLAVSVKVLEPVVLLGLNDAVTPLGIPEAVKLTLLLKPPCAVKVTVLVPLPPCMSVKLLGDVESVKLPSGFTLTEIVVLFVMLPDFPPIVTVNVPTVAAVAAERVKTLLVVAGFVPNEAVTPPGSPDAVKVTLSLNPLRGLIVMVVEPAPPWSKVTLLADEESVKPG